jgi:hypothetical protein
MNLTPDPINSPTLLRELARATRKKAATHLIGALENISKMGDLKK